MINKMQGESARSGRWFVVRCANGDYVVMSRKVARAASYAVRFVSDHNRLESAKNAADAAKERASRR